VRIAADLPKAQAEAAEQPDHGQDRQRDPRPQEAGLDGTHRGTPSSTSHVTRVMIVAVVVGLILRRGQTSPSR
jgi:hypothetical protein